MIGPNSPLGTFVGTDAFWVRVTLPLESATLLGLFQNAAELNATVIARQGGSAVERRAKVLEWTGELDTLSKTVQVLVEIDDPLSLKTENSERPPLLLGSLVQVDFQGPSQSEYAKFHGPGYAKAAKSSRLILKIDLLFVTLLLHGRVATHFMYVTIQTNYDALLSARSSSRSKAQSSTRLKKDKNRLKLAARVKSPQKQRLQKHHGMPTVLRLRLDQGPKRQEIKNHPHKALSKSTSKRS